MEEYGPDFEEFEKIVNGVRDDNATESVMAEEAQKIVDRSRSRMAPFVDYMKDIRRDLADDGWSDEGAEQVAMRTLSLLINAVW